jgi:hypothetical protein
MLMRPGDAYDRRGTAVPNGSRLLQTRQKAGLARPAGSISGGSTWRLGTSELESIAACGSCVSTGCAHTLEKRRGETRATAAIPQRAHQAPFWALDQGERMALAFIQRLRPDTRPTPIPFHDLRDGRASGSYEWIRRPLTEVAVAAPTIPRDSVIWNNRD